MQNNNPFRATPNTPSPAPLADQYYAPPPAPPPGQSVPRPTLQSGNSDVESLARAFDQELSLQRQPQHPPSLGLQHPQPAQWSSLEPPPSYSTRSPSAPPEMHSPPPPASSYPMMPDPQGPGNPGVAPSQPFLSAGDEKRRVHEYEHENQRDLGRDTGGWPSSSAASSSHVRTLSQTDSTTQQARSPGPPHPSTFQARGPGPSQPPESTFDKVLGRVKPRNPLDPPPEAFSRPPPPHISQGHAPQLGNAAPYYGAGGLQPLLPFPPMTLFGKDKFLEGGFPLLPPPSPVQPHPFAHRDVLEMDWIRFLEDLQIAGRLTGGQRVVAGVLPMTMHLGLGGLFVSRAIEKGMKKKKSGPVAELIDTWNHHFFRPRRMLVILAQGPETLSGEIEGPAPDWAAVHSGSQRRRSRSSSSSSSSSSDDGRRRDRHYDRHAAREERRRRKHERKRERREWKEERREGRRERKRERREGGRHSNPSERYRLVVVSL